MKMGHLLIGVSLLILLWVILGREDRSAPLPSIPSASPVQTDAPGPEMGEGPRLTRVEITPDEPDLQSVLKVRLETDRRPERPVDYRYLWRVNDRVAWDQAFFPLDGYRQGDQVTVEVTLIDDRGPGAAMVSRPVRIGNRPPVIKAIRLMPTEPKAGETIRAEVQGEDPDGDPVRYDYQWQANGRPIEGVGVETLSGEYVRSADQITLIVTASDGFSEGTRKNSRPVAVQNQPPEIDSIPPAAAQGEEYLYQVSARDSDGDAVRFQLLEGPPGMTVDAASGLLRWLPKSLPGGQTQVAIQADDEKGGKGVQRFVLQTP